MTTTTEMTVLERVTRVLEHMRVAGGWDDEEAAHQVLVAIGLDDMGRPVVVPPAELPPAPPAPELGGK